MPLPLKSDTLAKAVRLRLHIIIRRASHVTRLRVFSTLPHYAVFPESIWRFRAIRIIAKRRENFV